MYDDDFSTPEPRRNPGSHYKRLLIPENVQKSLNLLDEALGTTPTASVQPSRRSFASFSRQYPFTPGGISQLDLDNTIGKLNYTSMAPDMTLAHLDKHSEIEVESTSSTSALLLREDDTAAQVSSALSHGFLEALQSYSTENQVFQLLDEYERLCSEQLKDLKTITSVPSDDVRFRRAAQTCEILRQEKKTWRLLRCVYQDRIQDDDENDVSMDDKENQRWSEKDIIEQYFQRTASVRQNQIVIDWLENNAAEDFSDEQRQRVEYFTDRTVAWENTLNRLQQKGRKPETGRSLVTEMDPDAPLRQGKRLDDLDQEDETRLLQNVLSHVRAGQLDEAQRLCVRCGQPWRAATLEGWKLYHDPNYRSQGGSVKPTEGNPHRHLWKSVCWNMAKDARVPVCERAIYAALSGHLQALLPACVTWEDYLWAYYKAMVEGQVEQELHVRSTDEMGEFVDLENSLTPEKIFQELSSSSNSRVKLQSQSPYHLIQRYLILDDVPGLVEEFHQWLTARRDDVTHHLVRLLAHLILFLRAIGRSCRDELANSALESYVQILMSKKEVPLLASYVATLPSDQQVTCYARYLEGVEDSDERQTCLELAREARLDVELITRTVVENVRGRSSEEGAQGELSAETTEEDRRKISALDWLVYDPSQRAEALRQANALVRTFLASRKLDAARAVFLKIPRDIVGTMLKIWQMKTGSTELPYWQEVAVREYLCIQAYLDAQDSFSDWFEHLHHAKPKTPEMASRATFAERVAHEHKEQQYRAEVDRWQHTLDMQSKTTVGRLYNVLLFVDGGWMVDPPSDSQIDDDRHEDPGRQLQLLRLRQICIPQISLLLHAVLSSTGQFQECFQLADVIASEQNQLYKVFPRDHLREFLNKLRESSFALLDQSHDPLGFNSK